MSLFFEYPARFRLLHAHLVGLSNMLDGIATKEKVGRAIL